MSPKSSARAVAVPVVPMTRSDGPLHPDAIKALERCPLGIMQLNAQQEVVYANEAALALSGWRSYAGRTVRDLIGDEGTFQRFQSTFQERLRGIATEYELEFTRADGRRIPVRIAATPITDAQGNVTGAIGVIRSFLLEKAAEALDNRIRSAHSAHEIFE